MKIDFTSGEKRGLIALLVILTVILAFSVGMRMCNRSSHSPAPVLPVADTAAADLQSGRPDTTLIFKSSQKHRKKSGTKARQAKPDGPQRSFLDEPVEQ